MPYIYKITNDIDEMIYIGKTSHDNPYDRFKEHIRDSKTERCKDRQLYKHMNKYGQEHFHFNIIEEVENDKIACEREMYWISFYDTYRNGLNGTLGGDGKAYLCLNEEEVITYHTTIADYYSGRTAKYFKVDKETIQRILKKHNIKWQSGLLGNKKIYRVEENGTIASFISITQASKFLVEKENLKKDCESVRKNISKALRRNTTAYGYKWYYEQ